MARFTVLVTDYAWPDLDLERRILAGEDARLVAAPDDHPSTLADLASGADAILTCWSQVPREVLSAARGCRIVARFGIGLDNIDLACCDELGIPVTNVPDYCTEEVAEHTLALLLALARRIAMFHEQTKRGVYDRQAVAPMQRLSGRTLSVIGWGNIGRLVGRRAACLGLKVLAVNRSPRAAAPGVAFCDLDTALAEGDYVSLHVPLTADTERLMDASRLARMKPTACLINTARGGLVDHEALSDLLRRDRLAGAALDVQDPEPPDLTRPPWNDPRVIVTPHAAFLSEQSLVELRTRAARQVAARLRGEVPENVVNPHVLREDR